MHNCKTIVVEPGSCLQDSGYNYKNQCPTEDVVRMMRREVTSLIWKGVFKIFLLAGNRVERNRRNTSANVRLKIVRATRPGLALTMILLIKRESYRC